MEEIVEEIVLPDDLKRFEKVYSEQLRSGGPDSVSPKVQFEYAWCLVRSQYKSDLRKGVALLEDLFKKTVDDGAKRDYLFYLAVGYTRLGEYEHALRYTDAILKVEPKNHQAQELKVYVQKKMKREGLIGMAVVGGAAALVLGALVGVGVAAAKASK